MAHVLDIINAINLVFFVVLMFLVVVKLVERWLAYRRASRKIPLLLKRDIFFFVPFATVMLAIMYFRWREISLSANPLWVIFSGTSVIGGLAYWVYVEYFKVDSD